MPRMNTSGFIQDNYESSELTSLSSWPLSSALESSMEMTNTSAKVMVENKDYTYPSYNSIDINKLSN